MRLMLVFLFNMLAKLDLLLSWQRVRIGDRCNKPFRIKMLRIVIDIIRCTFFDKTSAIHNTDSVTHMLNDSQVMGNE